MGQSDSSVKDTADPKMSSSREKTEDQVNLQTELTELKSVMTQECFKSAQHLVESWRNQTPPDPKDIHQIFSAFILLISDKATVKVFLVITGQTFRADQVLLEQVKNMGRSSTWKVETTKNLQECDVIIVFCPILSRVGSDVEAAMREDSVSSGGKPVILVLMHHTRDPDYSTDVRRWSETFQNVVLDVHVLFHETQPGLLRCSRNDRAVKLIQEELKKH
ncbi:uncharacterized protein LOC120555207 isoform X3 [Perca fluviatilis]|uniref:uncharacterized protein LOC120555207 isoform X3 n=1 Tax=Perca fluviatilis TaxID=8168 RepID=UPI00196382D7|nr:uncharacterized protein LOC120555207 isoform X3 [Perca fluviatilis]